MIRLIQAAAVLVFLSGVYSAFKGDSKVAVRKITDATSMLAIAALYRRGR
jgi:hypothetical protein